MTAHQSDDYVQPRMPAVRGLMVGPVTLPDDCHRWGRHYCYGAPVQFTNGRSTAC